ncbi:MAG TPA: aminoacyl-tRNA hydrolase [Thermomicrobiales bacterium]|nr:aminoacyl-tRNA hydrolase [Thermomicrobiales bacterium]
MRLLRSLFARNGDADSDLPEEPQDMPADAATRLIIGLGNPGRKYAETRHNAGFFVIDHLARRIGAAESRTRFRSEISEARRDTGRFILVQPQTYMNDSGIAFREVVQWYKVPLDQVLIVVDDLDIPYGEIRLRARGSAGGHNGLKSIFQVVGTQDISRLRIGIGRPRSATISHVLSKFSKEEEADLERIISIAADDVELWADRGAIEAMNIINDPANQPLAARTTE